MTAHSGTSRYSSSGSSNTVICEAVGIEGWLSQSKHKGWNMTRNNTAQWLFAQECFHLFSLEHTADRYKLGLISKVLKMVTISLRVTKVIVRKRSWGPYSAILEVL